MKVVIVGASGFIGSQLSKAFAAKGNTVVKVSHLQISTATLSGADVVINLSGSSVEQRWTKSYMREIYGSRVSTTKLLVDVINILPRKPKVLLNASAVGVYEQGGVYKESENNLGHNFLADLCKDWEKEACGVSSDVRLVLMRLGFVMSREGGALHRVMKDTRRLGFAVQVGDGKMWIPWIAIDDLIRAVMFIIDNEQIKGVVNMVNTNDIIQSEMAQYGAKFCGVKRVIKMPIWMLKLFIGGGATALTETRHVYPEKLLNAGFVFEHEDFSRL